MSYRLRSCATATMTMAFAACSVPGAGVSAKDCGRLDIEAGTGVPQNLGGGFVGAEGGYGTPAGEGSYYQVTDCRSAKEITLIAQHQASGAADGVLPSRVDKQAEVAAIRTRLEANGLRSLDELSAMAAGAKVIAQPYQQDRQSCGCQAFYPELRGNLPPYAERTL